MKIKSGCSCLKFFAWNISPIITFWPVKVFPTRGHVDNIWMKIWPNTKNQTKFSTKSKSIVFLSRWRGLILNHLVCIWIAFSLCWAAVVLHYSLSVWIFWQWNIQQRALTLEILNLWPLKSLLILLQMVHKYYNIINPDTLLF